MPQSARVKNSFTFVKGLNSEASPLIYPEDTCIDLDNFELNRDGSITKRLGIDYESNYVKTNRVSSVNSKTVRTYLWKNVNKSASTTFLVVENSYVLEFFHIDSLSADGSFSNTKLFQTVDLVAEGVASPIDPSFYDNEHITFTSGNGVLFLNGEGVIPCYIKFVDFISPFEVITYDYNVRDFEGREDGYDVNERRSSLDADHLYNLINQGWGKLVTSYKTAGLASDYNHFYFDLQADTGAGLYPSNADIPYLGMTAASGSNPELRFFYKNVMDGKYIGNSHAPKGSTIIQRPVSSIFAPKTSEFFFGRLITSYGSEVLFSQILDDGLSNVGDFYQVGDPTAEINSDLVDTDGGSIKIPEAGDILKIVALGRSLLIFSKKGVWSIDGGDSPFTARNLEVSLITNIGVNNNRAITVIENGVIYHNDGGIYLIERADLVTDFKVTPISIDTIHTYFLSIPEISRKYMRSEYDVADKKVYWLYSSDVSNPEKFDKILILNLVIGSFYPLSIASLDSDSPYISSIFYTGETTQISTEIDIVDSTEDPVITSALDQVVISGSTELPISVTIHFVSSVDISSTSFDYTFSQFKNINFLDWETEDSTGKGYEAFVLTGYSHEGDIMRYKQAPYIQCAFNRSETRFVDNGLGGITFDRPSSCLLETRWDWVDNSSTGKVTDQQQVYRFVRPYLPGPINDPFNNGYPVVTTKSKIRGRGRALSLKFISPAGYDCQMLGWAMVITGGTNT